jgi:drug/metabolite transporter, DME family
VTSATDRPAAPAAGDVGEARPARWLPYAAVVLAASSWGTWSIWLRFAESFGPLSAALESTLVMAVITLGAGVSVLREPPSARAAWRVRGWLVCLGVSDALNVFLFFCAYKITVGVSVLAHYLTPVLVAAASPVFLRERLARRTLGAVAAAFAGLALMLAVPEGHVSASALWTSAALGAASAVFYASNVIVNKFIVDDLTTSGAVFWHGVVATPVIAAFVPASAWLEADLRSASVLALIAIGPGAGGSLAFMWGLRRMPAAHASMLTLLEPLVAVLVAAAVFGEELGVHEIVGGALILGAAFVVMSQRALVKG